MSGLELLADGIATYGLDDREHVENALRHVAAMTGMRIIGQQSHVLPSGSDNGPGVSAVAIIAESHIAIHTWPEANLFTFTMYSCRPFPAPLVVEYLTAAFHVKRWITLAEVERAGYGSAAETELKAAKQVGIT